MDYKDLHTWMTDNIKLWASIYEKKLAYMLFAKEQTYFQVAMWTYK
jgi:hypothetical protein